MPAEAIQRVSHIGFSQSMPATLTFADRHGRELPNRLDDLQDEHLDADSDDESYAPSESDDDSTVTADDDDDSDDDDDGYPTLRAGPHNFPPHQPAPDDATAPGSRPSSPSGTPPPAPALTVTPAMHSDGSLLSSPASDGSSPRTTGVNLNETFDEEAIDEEDGDDDFDGPQIYDDEFGSLPSESTGVD
eukprot:scaffold18223_cov103-Cylindrotheca_fusiformis.AAC.1